MNYDEVKALVEKLDKFRQTVQLCAADGTPMVMTDRLDHLLREAILCIEELEGRTREKDYFNVPMVDPCLTEQYSEALRQMQDNAFRQYGGNPFNFDGSIPLPSGMGSSQVKFYKQDVRSFAELAENSQAKVGMPDWMYEQYKGK